MEFVKARINDVEKIRWVVSDSINNVYPKFYSENIVNFFLDLHSKDNIIEDILKDRVWKLVDNCEIIGTGTFYENHITRVYVPFYMQNKGYGSIIMSEMENKIFDNYEICIIDSSKPSYSFYSNRGYEFLKDESLSVNDEILKYEIMIKKNI